MGGHVGNKFLRTIHSVRWDYHIRSRNAREKFDKQSLIDKANQGAPSWFGHTERSKESIFQRISISEVDWKRNQGEG